MSPLDASASNDCAIRSCTPTRTDHLRAFLELEKRVVERVCRSIERASQTDVAPLQRIQDAALQSAFIANLTRSHSTSGSTALSIYTALAAVIGHRRARPKSRNHRQRQFAELFIEMETWLEATRVDASDEPEAVHPLSAASTEHTASVTMAAPFDLERDSVLRQVRSLGPAPGTHAPRRRKKLDPMKCVSCV